MNTMDEKKIQSLLDRFMEGETTLEEEKILGEYFRSNNDVKAEWKAYKSMFAYFDKGMPYDEAAPMGMPYDEAAPKVGRTSKMVKMIVGALSAAALVALLFALAMPKNDDKTLADNNQRKTEKTEKSSVKAVKKEASKEEADQSDSKEEKKADVPAHKKARKRAPRVNFGLPAPQEYIADSEKKDTLDLVDKELMNSYLYQCASMDVAMEEIYSQEMEESFTSEE